MIAAASGVCSGRQSTPSRFKVNSTASNVVIGVALIPAIAAIARMVELSAKARSAG